jgi:hypothetical protein
MANTSTEEQKIHRMIHRVFDPADTDIFYHYCSNETLRLICQNKTLRFSDVNMLNDYAESIWGYGVFEDAASLLLRREAEIPIGITRGFLDCVDPHLGKYQHLTHPTVCSFSRNGDILSQWRAYADGGNGVAIGFGGRTLRNLDAWKLEVEYDPQIQVTEFFNSLIEIHASDNAEVFVQRCRTAVILALAYKNPAFREEGEVRCVHMLDVGQESGRSLLRSPDKHEVKFRTQGADVIAYVDLPISLQIDPQPIKRIVMGPKNPNKARNLEYMLRAAGIGEPLEITKSSASLR